MNISRLVRQARKGDKEALLQLILADRDAYYRLAFTYMGNEHDALDAMDDMIVTLYEKIGQLQKSEAFYSWSKTILVNRCKTLLRNSSKVLLREEEPEGSESLGKQADPYLAAESGIDLNLLLSHLNEQQREAIELRYVHDFAYQTIADMTGVPLGTTKSRISQGIEKLRKIVGGDRYEYH